MPRTLMRGANLSELTVRILCHLRFCRQSRPSCRSSSRSTATLPRGFASCAHDRVGLLTKYVAYAAGSCPHVSLGLPHSCLQNSRGGLRTLDRTPLHHLPQRPPVTDGLVLRRANGGLDHPRTPLWINPIVFCCITMGTRAKEASDAP